MSAPDQTGSDASDATDDGMIRLPMRLQRHDDGLLSLTFGPATPDEIAAGLQSLAEPGGLDDFVDGMRAAMLGAAHE